MTFAVRIAQLMRKYADRWDDAGAPHATGWSFTFEGGLGIVFHSDGRGCPLWYLGAADYDRAHLHAGPERAPVDTQDVTPRRPAPYPRVRAQGRAPVT